MMEPVFSPAARTAVNSALIFSSFGSNREASSAKPSSRKVFCDCVNPEFLRAMPIFSKARSGDRFLNSLIFNLRVSNKSLASPPPVNAKSPILSEISLKISPILSASTPDFLATNCHSCNDCVLTPKALETRCISLARSSASLIMLPKPIPASTPPKPPATLRRESNELETSFALLFVLSRS